MIDNILESQKSFGGMNHAKFAINRGNTEKRLRIKKDLLNNLARRDLLLGGVEEGLFFFLGEFVIALFCNFI